MRYHLVRKMDISNGPGVRVSVFMQGCEFHCKNCFNPETWCFDGGQEFTDEKIDEVMKLKEVLNYLDVLVDGQYVDELHDPTLKWRGSSNQRVIDVQKSLKENKVVLLDGQNSHFSI